MEYEIKDLKMAEAGKLRIDWAANSMPVLGRIKEKFSREKPLKGLRIAACLHVTSETANLVIALKAGGAEVRLT
ncbi:MAG: adenosylhomocysteinase, partial [Candidatus Aminicenantes bacterium]|nr:adenosylhomocysteinase [Candidatus Aminicenantes bacterium]